MSDALDRGISVTEMAPVDEPIATSVESTAAFVGRALRGPLDTPVLVTNFGEFRRRFGGKWSGSSLGSAVEQFFVHGGRRAYVVRVANNARGAMLCLPAAHGVLVLRALEPGSAEHLRAAVDFDGVDPSNDEFFNLTLQRVAPDTGLVLDQEIHRRLSCNPEHERFVADRLVGSALVRASEPLPQHRPLATGADYVEPAQSGTDGLALSDYDLIGSSGRGTGLFALDQVDRFDLLYLPPPAPGRTPGPAAVLASELYCRKRGAMLVIDPPESWQTAEDAITGLRRAGYANQDALSYFPLGRRRDDPLGGPVQLGGAIAGLLCKLDRIRGPWEDLDQRGFGLDRALMPRSTVDAGSAHRLVKEGLNVIAGQAPGHVMFCGSVTLLNGTGGGDRNSSLTTRRLCLAITNAIDRATRWAVFGSADSGTGERVVNMVHDYLCRLADAGAFENPHFVVHCEPATDRPANPSARGLNLLLAFHPRGAERAVSLTLHQTPAGCRVAATAFAPIRPGLNGAS